MTNIVYIATSLDGFISAPDGSLDWLEDIPDTKGDDLGWADFMGRVDAVVMGRATFEIVLASDWGWHYPIPGIILSSKMNSAPKEIAPHVQFANAPPKEIVQIAMDQGFENLYIDGGKTIQGFLDADLIDEMIITEFPILLGGGDRLFGSLKQAMEFELVGAKVLLGHLVQKRYRRKIT